MIQTPPRAFRVPVRRVISVRSIAHIALAALIASSCSGCDEGSSKERDAGGLDTQNDAGVSDSHGADGVRGARGDVTVDAIRDGSQSDGSDSPWATPSWKRSRSTSAPLNVTPRVLWEKTVLPGNRQIERVIEAGNRLVVSDFDTIAIVRPDGEMETEIRSESTTEWLSRPIADPEGNFYVFGAIGRSFRPNGEVRWRMVEALFSAADPPDLESASCSPEALAAGVIIVVCNNGNFYGIRSSDGHILWKRSSRANVPGRCPHTQMLGRPAGGGRVALIDFAGNESGLHDVDTGILIAPLNSGGVLPPSPMFWTPDGIFGSDWGLGENHWMFRSDHEGQLVWKKERSDKGIIIPFLTVPGSAREDLVVVEISRQSDEAQLSIFSPASERVVGPVKFTKGAHPIAIGADGTIFTASCILGAGPSELTALTPDLQSAWKVSLSGCPRLGVTLRDDGIMYLATGLGRITAVQTRSPGLADTAWPLFFRDNQASAWLP